jgi:hypothetical protein
LELPPHRHARLQAIFDMMMIKQNI